jgi:hypothetical protein
MEKRPKMKFLAVDVDVQTTKLNNARNVGEAKR